MPLEIFVQRLPPSVDFMMPFLKNAPYITSAFVGSNVAWAACAGVDRRFQVLPASRLSKRPASSVAAMTSDESLLAIVTLCAGPAAGAPTWMLPKVCIV